MSCFVQVWLSSLDKIEECLNLTVHKNLFISLNEKNIFLMSWIDYRVCACELSSLWQDLECQKNNIFKIVYNLLNKCSGWTDWPFSTKGNNYQHEIGYFKNQLWWCRKMSERTKIRLTFLMDSLYLSCSCHCHAIQCWLVISTSIFTD